MNTAQPILQTNRTVIIDIIRGFALFGVLIANLEGFISFALPAGQVQQLTNTVPDKITEYFVSLFIENKFITIFSLLFGYGFGVVIENVSSKGIHANAFFIRRMLLLLLLGLIHLCFWWGEILNVYASCGLLLLMFRKASNKTLLAWGAVFLFICAPFVQALKIYLLPANPTERDLLLGNYVNAMHSGNIVAIASSNYKVLWYIFFQHWSQFRDMFEVLGKFLFGYFILKNGYLKSSNLFIPLFKKVWKVSLVISLFYFSEVVYTEIAGHEIENKTAEVAMFIFTRAGILSVSLFYCCSLLLIYNRYKNVFIFNAFQKVGMMSLSSYLSQTLFYCLFFYGFGFNFLGRLHMQWVIPFSVVIFTIQIFISIFWMKNFQYGFAEWIWRMLSYQKYIALRKKPVRT